MLLPKLANLGFGLGKLLTLFQSGLRPSYLFGYLSPELVQMGTSGSKSETPGVKAQAEGSTSLIYSLLDLNGEYFSVTYGHNLFLFVHE